jgi:hypothetical protein
MFAWEETRGSLVTGDVDLIDPTHLRKVVLDFLRVCERQYSSRLAIDYADSEALNQVAFAGRGDTEKGAENLWMPRCLKSF